jgi:UDPglucose 6-dehydrogenase
VILSVVGTGYLGATHAACMARLGFTVVGLDTDEVKIERLAKGDLPFYEPDLDRLLAEEVVGGRLTFTTDALAIGTADVHFICVGTPQSSDSNAADLKYVYASFDTVARHAKDGSLLVGKSTVPVGTAAELADRVAAINPTLEVAWNPEFLREGFAVQDTLSPDRLVVGVRSDGADEKLREVYADLLEKGTPWVRADFETAELVKVAANSFLATKISFINAMAEVCETVGADVTVLAKAIGYDPRIGNRFLQAGLGFGGGCLPKDIRAFMARAEELGADQALSFLAEVDAINLRRRQRMVDLATAELEGEVAGSRVAVLGAAFKPNSDDVRDSPALDVARMMRELGASVVVYDPKARSNAQARFPDLEYVDDVKSACTNADLVLHLTEWPEFREIDPTELGSIVKQRKILDGRSALEPATWRAAGWTFKALGRP